MIRHRGSWGPRIQSSTHVKKGRQCSQVATVRWQVMASVLWDQRIAGHLAKFKKLYSWWKRKIANPISDIDDSVTHIFRSTIRKLITGPTLGAEGQREIIVDRSDTTGDMEGGERLLGWQFQKTTVKVDARSDQTTGTCGSRSAECRCH